MPFNESRPLVNKQVTAEKERRREREKDRERKKDGGMSLSDDVRINQGREFHLFWWWGVRFKGAVHYFYMSKSVY